MSQVTVRPEVETELRARGEKAALGMIAIRNPAILNKYDWKGPPYPSYVSAVPLI